MKEIKYIEVSKIYPHPDNPRKELGDLTELADSIRENGIFQNLTVIPGHFISKEEYMKMAKAEGMTKPVAENSYNAKDWYQANGYTVIIGHRRLSAAKLAGLETVPCIVTEMDEKTQLSTMLLENMQRSDLTAYEQAQGFQMMLDLGTSVAEISEKTGFAESTVRKRLKIAALPAKGVKKADERGARIEDYVKICDIEDEKTREVLLEKLGTNDFEWRYRAAASAQKARKNMPLALEEVKKITDKEGVNSDVYSGQYETVKSCSLADYTPGAITPEKIQDDSQYVFVVSHNTTLYLLKKYPKKKKEKPVKSKKEIKADERRKQLKDIAEKAHSLRFDFVMNFTAHKKHIEVIAQYLAKFSINNEIYNYSCDRKLIKTAIGQIDDTYAINQELLTKFLNEEPYKAATVAAYLTSGDSNTMSYHRENYGAAMPEYQKSTMLDLIYEFLCDIGYQMSDEEKALQNGTHELFEVKK